MSDKSYFPGKSIEEIADLSDEQIDRFVKLALAEAGVPIFTDPGMPPVLNADKDVTAYKVGDWDVP